MRVDIRPLTGACFGPVNAPRSVVDAGGPAVAYLGDCVPIYRLSGPTRWAADCYTS